MKKVLLTIIALVLTLCVLTGCGTNFGFVAEISDDFKGTFSISFGYSEKVINDSLASGNIAQADVDELTKYEMNGNTYYGQITTAPFIGSAEFNSYALESTLALASITQPFLATPVDAGSLVAGCEEDGTLVITYTLSENTLSTEKVVAAFAENRKAEVKDAMKKSYAAYELALPCPVKQISGATTGVKLEGDKLIINVIELADSNPAEKTLTFKSEPGMVKDSTPIVFDDVKDGKWYYDAVYTMANKGVVKGVGDGKFNPDGTLTYAEFCQVLAGYTGLETGSANGYWAYKAIESCVNKGYLNSLGDIKNGTYGVTIPREAAVSAMVKASTKTPTGTFTKDSIPDYDYISDIFKEDILKAYNLGITTGVDSNHTFNPKKSLSRAEICQLFMTMK